MNTKIDQRLACPWNALKGSIGEDENYKFSLLLRSTYKKYFQEEAYQVVTKILKILASYNFLALGEQSS